MTVLDKVVRVARPAGMESARRTVRRLSPAAPWGRSPRRKVQVWPLQLQPGVELAGSKVTSAGRVSVMATSRAVARPALP